MGITRPTAVIGGGTSYRYALRRWIEFSTWTEFATAEGFEAGARLVHCEMGLLLAVWRRGCIRGSSETCSYLVATTLQGQRQLEYTWPATTQKNGGD